MIPLFVTIYLQTVEMAPMDALIVARPKLATNQVIEKINKYIISSLEHKYLGKENSLLINTIPFHIQIWGEKMVHP